MNQNIDIYYKNKDSQVTTPNPTTTQAAIAGGQPLPLINSYFIQNTLGPNGTSGTMVDDIYNAILLTKQVIHHLCSYQIKQIKCSIQPLF